MWYLAMIRQPHRPNTLMCSFALKSCTRVLALIEWKQIHAQLVGFGFKVNVRLQTTVLDPYTKCVDLDRAEQVFNEMPLRDVATWNALVTGLAQGSRPSDTLALFSLMRLKGARPNEITVIGALSACPQLGPLEGEAVRFYMCEDLNTNLRMCNTLIDMYAKYSSIDGALDMFSSMGTRSRVTWNTIIMVLTMHGRGHHAIELFTEIRPTGVKPDAVTYLAMLSACNHAGLVVDELYLFNDMAGSGVAPNIKHYECIVDLLSRVRWLNEAYNIIISMHLPPEVILWQSLLGACKTYKNVELVECASQRLFAIGSNSDRDCVLMSNVYVAHERWDDIESVREAMKSNDVRKVSRFNFIEMNSVILKSVNDDHGHPDWKEIYGTLNEIGFRIKAFGYLPKADFVLHDIGDEEKENVHFYHNEKLVIAYDLVRTESRAPIQVIKNLRMLVITMFGSCSVRQVHLGWW